MSSGEVIFVFGSNTAGRHGKGAALTAKTRYGAQPGAGAGRTGQAYAIPTKNGRLETLPLTTIQSYVTSFLWYASHNPELIFRVTRIGCGYAGYDDSQIAPMFANAPDNCRLPAGWRKNK